jgi:hypothetical protein
MPDPGLRARVERLLRGDIRSEDLVRLFLYARDRCDGREPVQEIGDFVAHHDERTKGIVTRETRDWFLTARFFRSAMQGAIDAKQLPSNFTNFLDASLRRISEGVLRQNTGLSRRNAQKVVKKISEKLGANRDGTLLLAKPPSKAELELLRCLTTYLTVRPAFTGERLFSDFSATLKSHALLQRGEVMQFERLKPSVVLFAATVMHNCTIQIGDGSSSKLKLANSAGAVQILATVPFKEAMGEYHLASAIFLSDLKASEFFTSKLSSSAEPWDFDVELTPEGLLDRLG